ncbi:DUF1203 domain-containing protein [Streptomyces purpurascens]|uniref:DUF1203 domain-containing protein n=1 Tax=Streptomyces purpurascens TaxID=1924 RepID=A0ABZ1MH73_STREF|nr:DUF1203 domain-containing protein [Streptomyces purpurascens]MCE7045103.1 DUF1203 domain-containing protein [Streptomyces purpurascens]GHA12693.1 hypothetical protein GCM10010303_23450 [Streptomyces purpurascens]
MTTTNHSALPITPRALKDLRTTDDAGRLTTPFTDAEGGAPLRCCLRRAEPGERIALVSYAPLRRWASEQDVDPGAYDEQGPVFIHAEECGGPDTGALPFTNSHRTVRRYSAEGRILGGRLVEDPAVFEEALTEAFDDPAVELVHVRAVEYGCFLYEVRRDQEVRGD